MGSTPAERTMMNELPYGMPWGFFRSREKRIFLKYEEYLQEEDFCFFR